MICQYVIECINLDDSENQDWKKGNFLYQKNCFAYWLQDTKYRGDLDVIAVIYNTCSGRFFQFNTAE